MISVKNFKRHLAHLNERQQELYQTIGDLIITSLGTGNCAIP